MKREDRVLVEFYGIARLRAGRAELTVPAGTLGEVLEAVTRACPGLEGLLSSAGEIAPHYRVSLGSERFVHNLQDAVVPGERVLILSADVGG